MNNWFSTQSIVGTSYKCGYCGMLVGPSRCYTSVNTADRIFICPNCGKPTYYCSDNHETTPGTTYGDEIKNLPELVGHHYNEARNAYSVNAYTGAVLLCRKIIMNTAVDFGATQDAKFIVYVNYLKSEGYIGKTSFDWVDKIRDSGNDATHELPNTSKQEAEEIIHFTYMLLKTLYEFASP